jgi:hypothetical protein
LDVASHTGLFRGEQGKDKGGREGGEGKVFLEARKTSLILSLFFYSRMIS